MTRNCRQTNAGWRLWVAGISNSDVAPGCVFLLSPAIGNFRSPPAPAISKTACLAVQYAK